MSEMEFRIGKIKEIAKDAKTIEEKLNVAKELGLIDDEAITEYLEDNWLDSDNVVVLNKRIFEVIENKDIEEDGDLCDVEKLNNDEYSFKLRYYNGGTCFSEILEEGMEKYN